MTFLRVKNWRKRQSYEGRVPQWIKLFRELLNPVKQPEYAKLSDLAKLHLLHIWLLAAECEGDVPRNWIDSARLNIHGRPRLQEILDAGFLAVMDDVNRSDNQNVIPSVILSMSDSDSPSDSFDGELEFSEIWQDILGAKVPKPVRKVQAEKNFAKTVKSPEDVTALRAALKNYRASGRVERGWIMDASRFMNEWREWEIDPDSPAKIAAVPDPRDEIREFIRGCRLDLAVGRWPHEFSREEFDDYVSEIAPDNHLIDNPETFEAWRARSTKAVTG